MQTQLHLLGGSEIGMPDTYQANGDFDAETEQFVRAFQRHKHVMVDGVVGDETWNVLHGFGDNVDPQTDGRAPHTYVEQTPRLEWENDGEFDVANGTYTYIAMNVGQTEVQGVVATVRVLSGPVGLVEDHCIGWTDSMQPAGPGEPMKFTFWLDRPLTQDEWLDIELKLPDANGGATFSPILSGPS